MGTERVKQEQRGLLKQKYGENIGKENSVMVGIEEKTGYGKTKR